MTRGAPGSRGKRFPTFDNRFANGIAADFAQRAKGFNDERLWIFRREELQHRVARRGRLEFGNGLNRLRPFFKTRFRVVDQSEGLLDGRSIAPESAQPLRAFGEPGRVEGHELVQHRRRVNGRREGLSRLSFKQTVQRGDSERGAFVRGLRKKVHGQVEFGGLARVANPAHGFARENSAERHGGRTVFGEPGQAGLRVVGEQRLAGQPNHVRQQRVFGVGGGFDQSGQDFSDWHFGVDVGVNRERTGNELTARSGHRQANRSVGIRRSQFQQVGRSSHIIAFNAVEDTLFFQDALRHHLLSQIIAREVYGPFANGWFRIANQLFQLSQVTAASHAPHTCQSHVNVLIAPDQIVARRIRQFGLGILPVHFA